LLVVELVAYIQLEVIQEVLGVVVLVGLVQKQLLELLRLVEVEVELGLVDI
jgi:hypothetical protein